MSHQKYQMRLRDSLNQRMPQEGRDALQKLIVALHWLTEAEYLGLPAHFG